MFAFFRALKKIRPNPFVGIVDIIVVRVPVIIDIRCIIGIIAGGAQPPPGIRLCNRLLTNCFLIDYIIIPYQRKVLHGIFLHLIGIPCFQMPIEAG